ncbi:late histone H2B.L4-like [Cervus elaphus]|uniref:late histone H2B.L4-like n=1 Tax=Cervus elaphus TaxID=9860 RepID=UPI001CC29845|nr:late histone H2B.L4-like [Cervus elaphus]
MGNTSVGTGGFDVAHTSSENSAEDLGTKETGISKTEPSVIESSETETSETEPSEPEPFDAEPKKAKLLRQVHTGLSLSHKVVNVMDSFVKDIFEWIAEEAGCLAISNNHCTITSGEIQTAVCLLLPGEICKYAMSEATNSVIRYNCCR